MPPQLGLLEPYKNSNPNRNPTAEIGKGNSSQFITHRRLHG
jgi:hypothetical protein